MYQDGICACNHVIEVGETCQSIADQKGIPLAQFLSLNPGLNCNKLSVGQVRRATHLHCLDAHTLLRTESVQKEG